MGGCPPTDRRLPPGLWAVAPQLMGGCPRAYGRLPSALWAVAPQSKFGVVGPCARTLQVRSERDSNGDTFSELWKRLDSIPSRLGGKKGLYMQLMKDIRPEYRIEAFRMFQLVLHAACALDPLDLSFAAEGLYQSHDSHGTRSTEEDLVAVKAPLHLVPSKQLDPRRQKTIMRLRSRSCGLLEIQRGRVQFMHKTAKDFFSRKHVWDQVFTADVDPGFDPHL